MSARKLAFRRSSPVETNGPSAVRVAATVSGVFALAGLTWVLFTDVLLYEALRDPVLIARFETAKGWAFVAFATLLVYAVAFRSAAGLIRAKIAISALVDSIADGLLLLGPDRTIARANPAARRMLRSDDLVGMDAKEFSRRFRVSYPDGSLVAPEELVSQRVFDEGGPLHYKAILHPRGVPELVISVTAAAVRERSDAPAEMVVSVMHDITAEEYLERLRDRFLATAAHTLKTPVAIIKANAQSLTRPDPSEVQRASAAIDRQCRRIDRLVQNLLALSRLRSSALQLHSEQLELAPLLEHSVAATAAESASSRLCFEREASPQVYADAERLSLSLRNLMDDALSSATKASPVAVRLAQHGRDAIVSISCRPISPDACGDLDGAYGERAIGRLVADSIVAAHGGKVREEMLGAEKVLWFSLPAAEVAGSDERK